MMSFRDARKIQPRREVTVTGRRVVLVVAAQALLVGGAFAAGYHLREAPRARAAAASLAATTDPLHALDSEDKRVDYTYEQTLTKPREKVELAAPREEKAPQAAPRSRPTGERAAAERAEKPARVRAVAAPRVVAPRVVAVRTAAAAAEQEGGPDEIRALEARMQRIARDSVRDSGGRKAAPQASTDDELLQAIGGQSQRAGAQRGRAESSRKARARLAREEE